MLLSVPAVEWHCRRGLALIRIRVRIRVRIRIRIMYNPKLEAAPISQPGALPRANPLRPKEPT